MMENHSDELENGNGEKNQMPYADDVTQIRKYGYKDRDRFYIPRKPPILFHPDLSEYLIHEINQTRMIVLWGKEVPRNDKNQFARVLAYKLKAYSKAYGKELEIREWDKNTDIYDIPVFLTKQEKGIYVLTEITPQMVQYDLESIYAVVQRKLHFLIITTNSTFDDWERFTSLMNLFQKLTIQELYDGGYLAFNLVKLLYRFSFLFPQERRGEFIKQYREHKENGSDFKELISFHLTPGWSIEDIVSELRGFDDLERFVQDLTEYEKKTLNDDIIEKTIKNIISTDVDFLKWYYQDLKERDRHLLLGMSLFSGLYENQLFVAMEELVENDWRLREPILKDFDYAELNKLKNYAVEVIETGEIERKIEVKLNLRRQVFNECWHNQKRLIVNSIQGMMNIVKNSIYRQPSLEGLSEFQITEETIDKLIQLEIPEYIIKKLRSIQDQPYEQWFELLNDLKNKVGQQSFELFKDKFQVIFDRKWILTYDEEFREIFKPSKKSQLYGSRNKIKLIHRVIGSTLRQIAYESLPLAEQALFFYASQEDYDMRNLAAQSLAQWKQREKDSEENGKYARELYTILNRWYKEPGKVFDPFGTDSATTRTDYIEERKKFLYATIILAIGYAASYDQQNQCAPQLLKLLREFIPPLLEEESGPLKWEVVADALGENTVPILMKYHLKQLHETELLYDLMRYATSATFIAYELSLMYLKDPVLFKTIIDRINEICEQLSKLEKKYQKKVEKLKKRGEKESETLFSQDLRIYPRRERLMSILIATYGSLPFVDGGGWLTAEETFRRLKEIFKKEPEDSRLRYAVADAVGAQIGRDFYTLKHLIRNILGIFYLRHYTRIAPGFFSHIADERNKLEKKLAGEKREEEEKFAEEKKKALLKEAGTEIDQDQFDPERKVTDIENELFNWILKGGYPFRLAGLLGLFWAYLKRLENKYEAESSHHDDGPKYIQKFNQLLQGRVPERFFSRLLIAPLCLWGLRMPIVILQLLPVISIFEKNIRPEFNEMLKIWRSKVEEKPIHRLGWALSIAAYLANNLALLWMIYFFLILLVWSVVDRFF